MIGSKNRHIRKNLTKNGEPQRQPGMQKKKNSRERDERKKQDLEWKQLAH